MPATLAQTLGVSSQGRPILGGRFAAGTEGDAALLVVAGVHGDEPSSVEGALELAVRLADGTVVPGRPVWLVPALNPDGLAGGRKNSARDVDLNRNFPAASF